MTETRRAPQEEAVVSVRAVVRKPARAASDTLSPPPLSLLLGPAGAGKTADTLSRFAADPEHALLLVASTPQADTRAEQLAALTGLDAAHLRKRVLPLHTLVNEIARLQPDNVQSIGRAFQRLILHDVVRQTVRPDAYFAPMRSAPGFVPALAERLREWKLSRLTPDALEAAALPASEHLRDAAFARKAGELAELYAAYEAFLRRHALRDEEDLLLRAIACAGQAPLPLLEQTRVLLVDGFYRFHAAQRDLFHALAYAGQTRASTSADNGLEVAITLPYDAARPLLSAAPERTLRALRAEFSCHETTRPFVPNPNTPLLTRLSAGLFAPETVAAGRNDAPNQGEPEDTDTNGPALQIFDAPNPYVEAEMVARAFHRLYATGRYQWNDFAIILRGMGDYAPILAAVFERYAIPLGIDGPERLTENPLVKTLLHLLRVLRHGWQRDDVMAFLKSSYTTPDTMDADALRRRACRKGVRAGREAWLALGDGLTPRPPSLPARASLGKGETSVPANSVPEDGLAGLLHQMAEVDRRLTAHANEPHFFVECVGDCLEAFGLLEQIARGESLRQQRDHAAHAEALEVMQAWARMAHLSGRHALTFAQFYDEVLPAWERASALATPGGDVVRVAEPYDARERPLKVAAVMGLTERVFPRRIMEDPFLRDEERLALNHAAGLQLEPQKARSDDERFLFYLAVTAPSERLLLSFPRSADESDTLPSFYLDDVRAVFASSGPSAAGGNAAPVYTVSRTLADVAPRAGEAVSARDRLLSACADLFDPGSGIASPMEAVERAAHRLQDALQIPSEADSVRAVLDSRHRPRLPRLDTPGLFAAVVGTKVVFSVSELETYGKCPFQYFLRYVVRLRLEADGQGRQAEGNLLHDVLRRHFRARQRTPDAPFQTEAELRASLEQHLEQALRHAPLDASPHQARMTRRVLTHALQGFAKRETRFTPHFGMTPAHFELAFGMGVAGASCGGDEERDGDADTDEEAERHHDYDPASVGEPLHLLSPDTGETVQICGAIDRVDFDASQTRALILDYKMGKPPEASDILRGRSLQMPLYLLAMQQCFNRVGAAACYDSMRENGRRRLHRTEHCNVRQFAPILPLDEGNTVTPLNREQFQNLVKTAESTAIRLSRGITSGSIEATPGDHCKTCAFGDVCRTSLAGHDGELLPLAPSAHPSA